MHIVKHPDSVLFLPVCFMDLEGLRRSLRTGDLVRLDVFREPNVPQRETRTKLDKQKRTVNLHVLKSQLDGERLLLKGRIAEGHHTASLRLGESIRWCFRDPVREKFLDEFVNSDMVYDVLALDASTAYHMKVGGSAVVVREHQLDWSGDAVQKVLEGLTSFTPKLVTGLGLLGQPVAERLNIKYLSNSEALVPPFVPGSKAIRQLLEGTGLQRDRTISCALLKAKAQGRLRPLEILDQFRPRVQKVYLFAAPLEQIQDQLLPKAILIDPRYDGYRPMTDVIELFPR